MSDRIATGGMWEFPEWEVEFDYECSSYGIPTSERCKHCREITKKEHKRSDGSKFYEDTWICPRVVVARNEGGYNSTGVCLDCILDYAAPKEREE